ncbi:MAG: AMP-binding protein [Candidatus Gastranaerophilales bacterium]|nr:AMP-binding protein [Candidatus Gastranaerophilales bacterium]
MVINSTDSKLTGNIASLEENSVTKNLNGPVSPENWQSMPEMWDCLAKIYPNITATKDPYHDSSCDFTYAELAEEIKKFASGLQYLELKQGEKVSIFSENSSRWLIADQGIMKAGGINAVRSSSAPIEELIYILKHSDSTALIVETPEIYQKLLPYLKELNLKFIITLWGKTSGDNIYSFDDVILFGKKHALKPVNILINDIATIIYTSGTTGEPKGAMLSHGNLLHQINHFGNFIEIKPKGITLSILPVWHAYERSCCYYLFSVGTTVIYTNLRNFKQDFLTYKPNFMVAVPRLWEAIYIGVQQELNKKSASKQKLIKTLFNISKNYAIAKRTYENLNIVNLNPPIKERIIAFIKAGILLPIHKLSSIFVYGNLRKVLGSDFIKGICGGGALAGHLEDFYEIIGIEILVGYGLTETSPVLTVCNPNFNLKGSVGRPLPFTQIKVVDPETFNTLPIGQKGVVFVSGPQVMQGYYKNPEATASVIDSQGWFNTGDIGWLTDRDDLTLTGRIKDLIVLSNGEKVEPQPVEDACLQSPYVKQIMLTGQDQRSLGAVVVPDIDALEKHSVELGFNLSDLNNKKVTDFMQKELNQHIKNRSNYRPYELISTIRLVSEQFSVDNGLLTQSFKIKRSVIVERYSEMITEMFKSFN